MDPEETKAHQGNEEENATEKTDFEEVVDELKAETQEDPQWLLRYSTHNILRSFFIGCRLLFKHL